MSFAATTRTVLIAERNPRIRAFLVQEFQAAGRRALGAANGRELAAAALAEPRPDVYVVDPDLPGLEALAHLPRPLVAYALLPECEGRPLLAAAAAVVEKGGDPRELRLAVEGVLRQQERPEDREERHGRP
jgi:CheY-like chemotaxis protein